MVIGNTPTRVGKTPSVDDYTTTSLETPPRVWGRQSCSAVSAVTGGNTPTRVGKTYTTAGQAPQGKKHPHACGEDVIYNISPEETPETPPRVWGRLYRPQVCRFGRGNTPTRVGKTSGDDRSEP
mgnify:CR=1 FL=1